LAWLERVLGKDGRQGPAGLDLVSDLARSVGKAGHDPVSAHGEARRGKQSRHGKVRTAT